MPLTAGGRGQGRLGTRHRPGKEPGELSETPNPGVPVLGVTPSLPRAEGVQGCSKDKEASAKAGPPSPRGRGRPEDASGAGRCHGTSGLGHPEALCPV